MKNRRSTHRKRLTEAQIRRIVRNEIAREILIREGFLETIAAPFKKLKDSAKKKVAEKAKDIASKLNDALKKVTVPEDLKKFIEEIPNQEGGQSVDKLAAMIPGFDGFKSTVEELKTVDLKKMLASEGTTKESIDMSRFVDFYLLEEERYFQKQEANQLFLLEKYGKTTNLLKEEIVLAAIAAWFGVVKTVMGFLGIVSLALKFFKFVAEKFGFKKTEEFLEKALKLTEQAEEWFRDNVAFPVPVQYAAYRAAAVVKNLVGKKEELLSFEKFKNSKEQKEMGEKLHKALLIFLLAEALMHVGHALGELAEEFSKEALESAGEGLAHAGKESAELAGKAGRAATEV